MIRASLAALALLVSAPAVAEDVAGFIQAGAGAAWREPSDDPPYDLLDLEYDTGTVLFAEFASRYRYGLLLRVDYAYTYHDTLAGGGGSLPIAEDLQHHDGRIAAFYAPWPTGPLDWRMGGGYLYLEESADSGSAGDSRSQDGGFLEGGVTWRATKRLSLDGALQGFKVDGDEDYDAEGAEARVDLALHAGGIDFTLGARYAVIERESPFDETVLELRLGVGGAWGWPEND